MTARRWRSAAVPRGAGVWARARGSRNQLPELAADLAATFPRDMRRLVRAARAGKRKLSVDLNRSEAFAAAGLERSTDRLILGLMASALIVGASIALPFDIGVRVLGLPLLSAIGYLTAAGVGARLVLSARRKRQDK